MKISAGKKRRKESKPKEERKESATKPPPLRKRSGKSVKSGKEERIDATTDQSEDSIKIVMIIIIVQ